jgi:cobalt-zinc-cadmium efflux system outer membrane protein
MALSPELAAAEAGLERARFALARARVEPYPDADLQYYPQHDNTTADDIHTVQFYLTVPLFDRNQGNITAAQARLAAARGEVDRLGLELRSRLASAFERYANAQQQTLQLLTSQRTYFQATLAYLDSLRDLRQSAAVIDGLLLTGGLEPTSGLD